MVQKRKSPSRKASARTKAKKAQSKREALPIRPTLWLLRWMVRGFAGMVVLLFLWVVVYAVFNPPGTLYIWQEKSRLGEVDRQWVRMDAIAPVMKRSVVAAEDANFCLHSGFDMAAIRAAIDEGGNRGASTLTQQVVKNVFLWHGRSWLRKALEAMITPMVELVWSKERILEVYLNVAEFDEGVFGVEAAARNYFRVGPEALSPLQAARLAAVLPSPKVRSASKPGELVRKRAEAILDGAATIRADGRAACFED
ncbi:monofunctional biosynthetic peptidoglycan transglycosylase [Thalassovita sp.]|uniref:monofunctional biosynthetic peptidoglycan transglycosylase n=1 Tax=Thalassovita sp. TaxID=1979401 RepID=UPI0039B6ED97